MTWRPLGEGGEPRRVGEGLDRLVRQYGMPSSAALGELFSDWGDIVGEVMASHCWPIKLEPGGVLIVGSAESAWATQLRLIERDLIAKINDALGEPSISSLKVRIGPRRTS